MSAMDSTALPRHIAIIMDGNGRWAELRNKHRLEGHRQGVEVVDDVVEHCKNLGIEYLTLYAFSHENWNRPEEEVSGLMDLLKVFLSVKREKLKRNGVRLRVIGEVDKLNDSVLKELTKTIEETKYGTRLTLVLALSYGARNELVDVMNALLRDAFAEGNFSKLITAKDVQRKLYSHFMPDPDLLIRTSGECRISNFMLWQLAYSELYFTDTLWPDFSMDELDRAIETFQHRERRYGKTSEQIHRGETSE